MADRRRLGAFVGDALGAGRSRAEIRGALDAAGWSSDQIDAAMAQWAAGDFLPPVPAPRPFVSARDAFLYALTFVALGIVVVNVQALAFDLIDGRLGETPARRRDMAWPAAALLVFAPVFVVLDRKGRRVDRENPVRKVFAYAALFFASLVLLSTAATLLALLLLGGLGPVIGAKAAVVAAIAAAVWGYYRSDLTGDRAG